MFLKILLLYLIYFGGFPNNCILRLDKKEKEKFCTITTKKKKKEKEVYISIKYNMKSLGGRVAPRGQ